MSTWIRRTLPLLLLLSAGCSGRNSPTMGTSGEVNVVPDIPIDGQSTRQDAENLESVDGGTLPEVTGETGPADAAAGDPDGAGADALKPDALPPPLCPGTEQPWLSKVCFKFCQKIATYDLSDMFAPSEECQGFCKEVLAENPDWLPNFLCVTMIQQHYQFSNCWWPKPLPAIPGCDSWCNEVLDCGIEDAYYIPDDQCLCEATCNGMFALTGEAAEPLVACAAKALEDTCSPEAVADCYTMPLNCEQTCQDFQLQCDPGYTLKPLFPDTNACVEQCQQSTQSQLYTLQLCLAMNKCHDPAVCGGLPEEPLPGCAEFCDAFLALCPFSEVGTDTCPWVCTAAAWSLGNPAPTAAASCLDQYGTCPGNPNVALFACLAGPCALMCQEAPKKCAPGSAWFKQFPTTSACEEVCSGFSPFEAQAAGMCAVVGGCDHPEACLAPPASPLEGCADYCQSLLDLCPSVAWLDATSCPSFCTGVGMQIPIIDPATAPLCLDQLQDCPANPDDAVFGCLAGKCGTMCGLFDYCKSGSQYYTLFESKSACKEQCDALSYDQAIETGFCLSFAGCDSASSCSSPPEQPQDGCDDYCQALLQLCPDNGVVNEINCLDGCTGLAMAIPVAAPEAAGQCIEAFDSCPAKPQEAVYGCLVEPPQGCLDACAGLEGCGLLEGWLCEVYCSVLEDTQHSSYEWLVACVDSAMDCPAMKKCIGQ